jgi:flavin reductase (DIM6/NTAB) family NADH-FMN oxidoreductase RutF
MAIDKDTFRRCMASFPAGVTVVTTIDERGEHYGLTATAFTSVSADPPLVLVCIDKKSDTHPCFEKSGVFAVNFLALDQESISGRFAKSGGDKFAGIAWRPGTLGAALLEGAIGSAECRIAHTYDGGDHTIFVGQIEAADANEGEPLVYFRQAYRRISDPA